MKSRKGRVDGNHGEDESQSSRLKAMLLKDYPEDCEELGEEELDILITLGLRQAKSYGIIREKDLFLYFDVMFTLAYNVDTHPEYPWAREILKNPNWDGKEKVERLALRA